MDKARAIARNFADSDFQTDVCAKRARQPLTWGGNILAVMKASKPQSGRTISTKNRILGGLWGVAVGDALGVPVEFRARTERAHDPVTDMRGHGTHNQPSGTWSDDTSLNLCTVDTLVDAGEDYQALAGAFVRWLDGKIWTPHGIVFDIGNATHASIRRLARGVAPLEAGQTDDLSNGNGSLMRILPVALWFAKRGAGATLDAANEFSALTHRHPRSQVGCGLYCLIAQELLGGAAAAAAIDTAWKHAQEHYRADPFASELRAYARIFPSRKLAKLPEQRVESSGYVVHTLEASLWCLVGTNSFEEAVLRAVNLGDDTDTVGAVTGGLAGIRYGLDAVPARWRARLARHDDLAALFETFAAHLS